MRKPFALLKLLAGALLVACAVAYCRPQEQKWNSSVVSESQKRGEEIVNALDRFVHVRGEFPEKLSLLLPEFLAELRPPVAGSRQWDYEPIRSAEGKVISYFLSFECSPDSYPFSIYQPGAGWYTNQ
ncbi:MAG: hypothetical protein JNJ88_18520 [Planctomycetes bacterium]|nr:hypothetical protein [Planctomycetota bacterium]